MHAARGMPGRPGCQLGALEQHHVLPAEFRQVIEHRTSDDTATDDDDLGMAFHLGIPCFRHEAAGCLPARPTAFMRKPRDYPRGQIARTAKPICLFAPSRLFGSRHRPSDAQAGWQGIRCPAAIRLFSR
ncbi:hypothetical protein RHSP_80128 [Rhizobium freirei PRF 81]|uniref:Uncharacterized protein n=1 Tax=Rhizobium freirei PRF 81 TaxID=363754 RepID=N6UBG8_9HYPH|nr:hypothetical protein RHSP_80128 [Rhizobium freirei PRF 81]